MGIAKVIKTNYYRENILKIRNSLGLTQSEFAEKIDLTLGGVQDIEYGKTQEPSFSVLRKIAALAKVDILSLDSPSGPVPLTEPPPSVKKAELLIEIYSGLAALDDRQLRRIRDMVKNRI